MLVFAGATESSRGFAVAPGRLYKQPSKHAIEITAGEQHMNNAFDWIGSVSTYRQDSDDADDGYHHDYYIGKPQKIKLKAQHSSHSYTNARFLSHLVNIIPKIAKVPDNNHRKRVTFCRTPSMRETP